MLMEFFVELLLITTLYNIDEHQHYNDKIESGFAHSGDLIS